MVCFNALKSSFFFQDILNVLKSQITESDSAEEIQTLLYEVGKKHQFDNLKDFFKLVYQVLLGQEQGPRLGSFIKLYGISKTIKLIDDVLEIMSKALNQNQNWKRDQKLSFLTLTKKYKI